MMKDMLDMVNCVVDSHSMSDALDTYDTIFRGWSSCSIDSSVSNNTHDPPYKIRDIKHPRIDRHIVDSHQPCRLVVRTHYAKESGPSEQNSSENPASRPAQTLGQKRL
jgi:hypothetical protein